MKKFERTTASCQRVSSCSGVSLAAECQSQSGSASQSTTSNGGSGFRPRSHSENQESSTAVRCFNIPPNVIDEEATASPKLDASSPAHFHANVARWYSRKPINVSNSSAARGGSG